jgi:simple sugar transport system permease protein
MTHATARTPALRTHSSTRAVSIAVTAGGVVLLTLGLLAAVLAVAGYAPGPALISLWNGSLGSWNALTSATLVRATPLLIGGLAITVAFRAGVLNIGVEGQLLAGAAAATACALAMQPFGVLALPAALAAGVGGGVAWATVPAVLKRRAGVLEVISTLIMNVIALHLIGWLVRGPLQEPTQLYPQSATIADAARLPMLLAGTRLHAGFALALVLALGAWWMLARTAAGFRLRATGANPFAAASAGQINTARVATRALLASAALAGLAGAVEVQGVTLALYESLSPGYGYTAIAVALLARLDPRAVVATAALFAALEAGASAMQRDAGVPAGLVRAVEAMLIIAVLVFDAWQRRRQARARVA